MGRRSYMPALRRHRRTTSRARLASAAAAALVASTAALLPSPRACAQSWVGPGGGNFSGNFLTASNWNPAAVPQPTSTATFSLNQSYTVTFSTNAATSALIFSNTTGVTTFGGTGITRSYTILSNATFAGGGTTVLGNLDLNVLGVFDVRSNNFFRVLGGSTLTVNILSLADAGTGANGTISVEGDAAELHLTGETFHNIGRFGDTGTLTFSNNALGTLGGGLALGDSNTAAGGKGFLNILSGADVTTEAINGATSANLSQTAGILVSGAGSTLTVTNGGSIVLGSTSLSKATFDVLAGATANLRHTGLTLNPTATMTVNNATLLTSGQVNVGGLLIATNGAQLTHNETSGFFNGFNVGTGGGGSNTFNIGGSNTTVLINGFGVGGTGPGLVNQSGGAVTLLSFTPIGAISAANAAGTYQLTGGTLSSEDISLAGLQSPGTFVQSGGTHTVGTLLRVAAFNGGISPKPVGANTFPTGAYTLNGGTLNAPTVWVGNSSIGIINHSGGTMTVTGELTLGGLKESNSILFAEGPTSGSYNLSGTGALTASIERVGWTAPGTFTQTGGANTVTSQLIVGDFGNGAYTLSAGTLSSQSTTLDGTFNTDGGTFTASGGLTIGSSSLRPAVYNLTGASAVLQGSGFLSVGAASAGTFNHTAGSNTLSGGVILGNSTGGAGTYTISGSATLSTQGLTLGNFGSGSFIQKTGSTVNVTGNIFIAFQSNNGGPGTYDLRGGTLTAQSLSLDAGAQATFLQSGGTATLGLLQVGGGAGTSRAQATLSGGMLHPASESIGVNGDGTFFQGGGTNLCDTPIVIGSANNANPGFPPHAGEYTLSNGTLTAPQIVVESHGTLLLSGSLARLDCPDLIIRGVLNTLGGSAPTLGGNTTFAPGSTSILGAGLNVTGTLTLQDTTLAGTGVVVVGATALLKGDGSVLPSVTNAGTIQADTGSLVLRGAALVNNGVLRNATGASLFVKATSVTNSGSVTVNASGAVVFDQPLPINSGKTLTLAGGTLGAPRLTNNAGGAISGFGQITGDFDNFAAATFIGPTQIFGNFTNRAGATLTVRNDQTLITGQSVNNGMITTVNGKVIFEGGLAPAPVPGAPVAAAPAAAGGGIDGSGIVSLSGASTLITSYVRQQELILNGTTNAPASASVRPKAFGGQTSVLSTLTIPSSGGTMLGRLDLADTALLVNYTGPASPLASIRSAILSGYHGGDWTGNGITSSSAAANRATALAYAEAADVLTFTGGVATFQGQSADPTTVLVRHTLFGDATLDGVVDFNDLVKLAQNYNTTVSAITDSWWTRGDFTYDGTTDFNDLVKLAQNYNTALPDAPIPGASVDFQRDLAAAFASVPEPGALPAAALLTGALLTRPRRRRNLRPPA